MLYTCGCVPVFVTSVCRSPNYMGRSPFHGSSTIRFRMCPHLCWDNPYIVFPAPLLYLDFASLPCSINGHARGQNLSQPDDSLFVSQQAELTQSNVLPTTMKFQLRNLKHKHWFLCILLQTTSLVYENEDEACLGCLSLHPLCYRCLCKW